MNLQDMPPHEICYELDRVCAPHCFTYSGPAVGAPPITTIWVYPSAKSMSNTELLAKFEVSEENPLEYVLTKILLQFSGGTTNA